MVNFHTWCRRYGYDPQTEEARRDYEEAQRQLDLLERAAARQEAKEAIRRAQEGAGDG